MSNQVNNNDDNHLEGPSGLEPASQANLEADIEAVDDMWVRCVANTQYEIFTAFPHQVRNVATRRILKESTTNEYLQVGLNGRLCYKHILIARQFIPNPNPETRTEVDHMNRIRSDNRIDNLRWVTRSQNAKNKTSHMGVVYKHVDHLPPDAHRIEVYSRWHFIDYWYSPTTQQFYYHGEATIRVLHVNRTNNGVLFVCAYDVENEQRHICINKSIRDLPFD